MPSWGCAFSTACDLKEDSETDMSSPVVFRRALNLMYWNGIELLIILNAAEDFVFETDLARAIGTDPGRGLSGVLGWINGRVEDAGGEYGYRASQCVEQSYGPPALRLKDHLRPVMTEYLDTDRGKRVLHYLLTKLVRGL